MLQTYHIKELAQFINQKYPKLDSVLYMNKANFQWIDWLNSKNVKTQRATKFIDREYQNKTSISNFFTLVHQSLLMLTDEREEWEKDVWDIRNLV